MSVFILFTGVSLVGDEHTGLSTKGGKTALCVVLVHWP